MNLCLYNYCILFLFWLTWKNILVPPHIAPLSKFIALEDCVSHVWEREREREGKELDGWIDDDDDDDGGTREEEEEEGVVQCGCIVVWGKDEAKRDGE